LYKIDHFSHSSGVKGFSVLISNDASIGMTGPCFSSVIPMAGQSSLKQETTPRSWEWSTSPPSLPLRVDEAIGGGYVVGPE
jgi:hypothetical protein